MKNVIIYKILYNFFIKKSKKPNFIITISIIYLCYNPKSGFDLAVIPKNAILVIFFFIY